MIVAPISVGLSTVGAYGRPIRAAVIVAGAMGFTWPVLAVAIAAVIPHHQLEPIMGGSVEDATLDDTLIVVGFASLLAVPVIALALAAFYRLRTAASTASVAFRAIAGSFAGFAGYLAGLFCIFAAVSLAGGLGLFVG